MNIFSGIGVLFIIKQSDHGFLLRQSFVITQYLKRNTDDMIYAHNCFAEKNNSFVADHLMLYTL